ncbi:hypothetical protein HYDPIDRAFT_167502 [Hydnomerulius pinastri MD-312]|uniref:Uncharacterized protein n=1 Tax=Hydnomerulius pinastri MD-312 TaxID=994086 RepID=A0A0C9WGE0_9AGAM|nr:hypothetical protein HYDPIDRAFT_167502 [Hydnomerulius pinastri MD-312]
MPPSCPSFGISSLRWQVWYLYRLSFGRVSVFSIPLHLMQPFNHQLYYPPLENEPEGGAVSELPYNRFAATVSTAGHTFLNNPQVDLAALSYPAPTADFPPYPYLDTDYPHPLGGFEGQRLAHALSRHFQFNFRINQNGGPVASASTYGPPSTPLEAPPSAPPSAPLEAPPSAPTPSVEPSVVPQPLSANKLAHEHDLAMSFIVTKNIPFIVSLQGLDGGAWVKLCKHLTVITWRHFAVDSLEPRLEKYWWTQVARLYCDFTLRGLAFPNINVQVAEEGACICQVPTCISEVKWVEKIITYLHKDTLRDFISHLAWSSKRSVVSVVNIQGNPDVRSNAYLWKTWKGLDQGFPLFHHYRQVPGFAQHQPSQPLYFENPQLLLFIRAGLLRPEDDSFLGLFDEVAGPDGHFYLHVICKLDFPLYEFTSGAFVTSIDFLLVRPNRKADTLWKNNTLSNIQLVSSFFFRVLSHKISGVHPTEQVDICTALMNVSTTLL